MKDKLQPQARLGAFRRGGHSSNRFKVHPERFSGLVAKKDLRTEWKSVGFCLF